VVVLPEETTLTITKGLDVIIHTPQRVSTNGTIFNDSESTLNIFGELYTYSFIKNGSTGDPGTINIERPGALFLLNALLENDDVNSTVNIKTGGNLYSYYSNIVITDGLIITQFGGNFDHVRGEILILPGFTFNTGSNFSDTDEINLEQNLHVDMTWTITQNTIINGYGNCLTFGPGGAIVGIGGVSLLLNDIDVNDISGNKIRFTDNSSTLSIHNVIWNQDANYSLTKGKFYLSGEWLITGDGTKFSYETNQTSTITSNASMICMLTTLEYNSDTANLIHFEDQTATLRLEHGTLQATKSCLLSDGTLATKGLATLIGDEQLNLSGLARIEATGGIRKQGDVIL